MNSFVRTTVLSVAVLATIAVSPTSSAHEPTSSPGRVSAASAWTEPIAALGGNPLAIYVGDHQSRRLGSSGV